MAVGAFSLKRQVGGRGMFAEVSLEVSSAEVLRVQLGPRLSSDAYALRYEPAARLGINYAWEKVKRHWKSPGANVLVLEIRTMPVDTTEMGVVYAAAMAMWNGLERQPAKPIEIVPESWSFVFPA